MKAFSLNSAVYLFLCLLFVHASPAAARQGGLGIGFGHVSTDMTADVSAPDTYSTAYQGRGTGVMIESNNWFFADHWSVIPLVAEFTAETLEGGSEELGSDLNLGGHFLAATELRWWTTAEKDWDLVNFYGGFQAVWVLLERLSKGLNQASRRKTNKPDSPFEPIDLKSKRGYGAGLVAGLEFNFGLFFKLQYTWARFSYEERIEGNRDFSADVDFESLRMHAGYRF